MLFYVIIFIDLNKVHFPMKKQPCFEIIMKSLSTMQCINQQNPGVYIFKLHSAFLQTFRLAKKDKKLMNTLAK